MYLSFRKFIITFLMELYMVLLLTIGSTIYFYLAILCSFPIFFLKNVTAMRFLCLFVESCLEIRIFFIISDQIRLKEKFQGHTVKKTAWGCYLLLCLFFFLVCPCPATLGYESLMVGVLMGGKSF